MLGILKKLYRQIPAAVSYPIIETLQLAPAYSSKHWRKVKSLDDLASDSVDTETVNESLIDIIPWLVKSEYYASKEYDEFLNEPTFKNFKNLPLIDSGVVGSNFNQIVNPEVNGYSTSTGGSGGNPLKLYLSDESYFTDRVYVFHAWSTLGYNKGDRKLTLRGVNLGDKLTEFNPMNNELNVNVFLLNKNNLSKIVKRINTFKPVFGHGYPSAWYSFFSLIKKSDEKLSIDLKGIYYASETVDSSKRDEVEEYFKVPVRSTYSSSERAYFAYELRNKKGIYKVMTKYGLLELLEEDRSDVKAGERGEIVCTGFVNEALPLVRYKTGDSAIAHEINDGIVTKIRDIKGRWGEDYIFDKDGNKIFTTSINIHSSVQFQFRYIQLHQKNKGTLEVRLVPINEKKKSMLNEVKGEFAKKMPNINVSATFVEIDDLYITKRGKIPYLAPINYA